MNESEYLKLKEQIIANATRRIGEIERDKLKQLDSLETIWQLVSSMPNSALSPVPQAKPLQSFGENEPAGTVVLADAVRQVLPVKAGFFNINNIIHSIERQGFDVKKPINPTSVSGALRKLQAAGVLELVEAGKGKRPSKYRVAEAHRISSESNQSASA